MLYQSTKWNGHWWKSYMPHGQSRDGTNGNLQDFWIPDRIESLKSKIGADTWSNRMGDEMFVLCCHHIESREVAILNDWLAKISKQPGDWQAI